MNLKKMVMAALVTGLMLLASSAWALQQDEPQAPAREGRLEHRLFRHLDLTPEQQAQIDVLRKAQQDKRPAFRDEMRKLREDFRGLRSNLQTDPAKAEALIDRMAKLRADWMKTGLRHRLEISKILTPEQREKLASLREKMERTMNRLGRRGQGFGRAMGRRGFNRPGMRFNRMRRFY